MRNRRLFFRSGFSVCPLLYAHNRWLRSWAFRSRSRSFQMRRTSGLSRSRLRR